MCDFLAYVAFNKATNGYKAQKGETKLKLNVPVEERSQLKSSPLPRKDRVWKINWTIDGSRFDIKSTVYINTKCELKKNQKNHVF